MLAGVKLGDLSFFKINYFQIEFLKLSSIVSAGLSYKSFIWREKIDINRFNLETKLFIYRI